MTIGGNVGVCLSNILHGMPEAGYPIVKGRFKCGLILNDLRISRPTLKIGAVSEGGPNFSKGAVAARNSPVPSRRWWLAAALLT